MNNRWLELRLPVIDAAVDLVSQALTDLGSVGIIAAECHLDTFVVPDPETIANAPVLRAFFAYPDDPADFEQKVMVELEALLPLVPGFRLPAALDCRELADADWASDWQQHFPPFKVGERLVICPSWTSWPAQVDETVLTLDPGQAFGTGTHATTSLCLDSLADLFAAENPPRTVLDVGTGSGILAMAAAALGANQVVACDIDAEACRIARDNVALNGLSNLVTISEQPIERLPGQFDLLLANILAAENLRLGPEFIAHLEPGGYLVLSGILVEQETRVREGYAALPLALVEVRHREEWTCMVYRRHE